jgi:phage replication initiation protein
VCIDWLNISFPSGDVRAICAEVAAFVGESGKSSDRGTHGYSCRVDFGKRAVVGYGGVSQRGSVLVSLSGEGCRRVASFDVVRVWGERLGGRITRVDLAADDFHAEAFDVARAMAGWGSGAFSLRGRPPSARSIDDMGTGAGNSFYVGSRDSGKLCRVYEKGKHLGDRVSKWVRAEVEFLARDRVIPWDVLTFPVRFLAGAYPFFACLSMVFERMRTFKRGGVTTLAAAVRWARSAVGRTVNVMLVDASGDIGAVLQALRRDGVPRGLTGWFDAGGEALCAS